MYPSRYRDSDHAPTPLGTHGLRQPKCQKFEEIPMRCDEKSPTASGAFDFSWGYGSRSTASAAKIERTAFGKEQKSISLEETRRSNLRGIPSPKSEWVRGTRISTTSLLRRSRGLTLWSSNIELVFHTQVEGARYALSIDWSLASILVTGPKADAFFEQFCEHGITVLNAALAGHRSHRE